MSFTRIKSMLPQDKYSLAVGFMSCVGLVVVLTFVTLLTRSKRISETREAGLASASGSLFYQAEPMANRVAAKRVDFSLSPEADKQDSLSALDRKIVRKGSLNIIVKDT